MKQWRDMSNSKKTPKIVSDVSEVEPGESALVLPAKATKNTAYFVPAVSSNERGPGILVLHSWWGLNATTKKFCEDLSDRGYCVLAPNFFGPPAKDEAQAQELLSAADPNEMADLVLSSIHALRTYSDDSTKPVAIIGFAMGGSLGLWASTKLPDSVSNVVSVYGSQNIDFDDATADYLLISAEFDEVATEDDMNFTQALIGLAGCEVQAEVIPGTHHGFWDENDASFNILAKDLCDIAIGNYLSNHFRSVK